MTIKELSKFLKLCRQQGVESIKFEGVEVHLGNLPTATLRTQRKAQVKEALNAFNSLAYTNVPAPDSIDTDEPSAEQLLFGSADPSVWAEQS